MTPEERWTRIENALQAVSEHQAQFEVNLGKLTNRLDNVTQRLDDLTVRHEVAFERMDRQITKLLEMQGTLMQSQVTLMQSQEMLTEAQKDTDRKLNALIETVDRFIQSRGNGRGNGERP